MAQTKQPIIQVILTPELATALKERAGKQRLSAYVRQLIEADIGLAASLKHGGNRHKNDE